MDYLLIALIAFGAAMLTFFSGFGLGTILLPAFALFFPVEIAIAYTAIVHLINNLFKLSLIWKYVNLKLAALFSVPAALFAIPGALLLSYLSNDKIIYTYQLGSQGFSVTLINLVIGLLLSVFAIIEMDARFNNIAISRKFLPLGGALSGFFGGLSGHQGALRALFLIRSGLGKEGFIATGIVSAIVIDISRLSIYGTSFFMKHFIAVNGNNSLWLLITACLSAFVGSVIGRMAMKKVTMRTVHLIVGILILIMSILIAAGII